MLSHMAPAGWHLTWHGGIANSRRPSKACACPPRTPADRLTRLRRPHVRRDALHLGHGQDHALCGRGERPRRAAGPSLSCVRACVLTTVAPPRRARHRSCVNGRSTWASCPAFSRTRARRTRAGSTQARPFPVSCSAASDVTDRVRARARSEQRGRARCADLPGRGLEPGRFRIPHVARGEGGVICFSCAHLVSHLVPIFGVALVM